MAEFNRSRGATPGATPTKPQGLLDEVTRKGALTPNGLFTNLFPVRFADGPLGAFLSAPIERAPKEEFEDRKHPRFYRSRETLYAFGAELDKFSDGRFSAALVRPETDIEFTKFLVRFGLMDFFRAKGFHLKTEIQGFTVQDHSRVVGTDRNGRLHIVQEFVFQPYSVELVDGSTRIALAIQAGTSTVPQFSIGLSLRPHENRLLGLKLELTEGRHKTGCVLEGRGGQVIGTFHGFAEPAEVLDCTCRRDDFEAIPIRVLDRGPRPRPGQERAEPVTMVVPGQLIRVAPAQRRVLGLFKEKSELERAGRVWVGSLTTDRRVRGSALETHYQRLQEFLAEQAGHATSPVIFRLPSGAEARLERLPIAVDEIVDAEPLEYE